jgi:hypothetical protein
MLTETCAEPLASALNTPVLLMLALVASDVSHVGLTPSTGSPSASRAMSSSVVVPPTSRKTIAGTTSTDATFESGPTGSSSPQAVVLNKSDALASGMHAARSKCRSGSLMSDAVISDRMAMRDIDTADGKRRDSVGAVKVNGCDGEETYVSAR